MKTLVILFVSILGCAQVWSADHDKDVGPASTAPVKLFKGLPTFRPERVPVKKIIERVYQDPRYDPALEDYTLVSRVNSLINREPVTLKETSRCRYVWTTFLELFYRVTEAEVDFNPQKDAIPRDGHEHSISESVHIAPQARAPKPVLESLWDWWRARK